jgi:hypothetical protein
MATIKPGIRCLQRLTCILQTRKAAMAATENVLGLCLHLMAEADTGA